MSRGGGGRAGRALVAVAVAAAGMVTAGCQEAEPAATESYHPSSVGEADESGAHEVSFTRRGADRAGLHVTQVRQDGAATVVDYAALIYDPTGQVWVFTSVGPRRFVRVPVAVDHIDGGQVWLADGPAAGAEVVTVGAAEVYGAELGIDGGH